MKRFSLFVMFMVLVGLTCSAEAFTINATANNGGTITPKGKILVNPGEARSFTITPDTGYHAVDVKVDGDSQGIITSWEFADISSNHSIVAKFAINTYQIATNASAGGMINPASAVVKHGTTKHLTIKPSKGYQIDSVTVNDIPQAIASPTKPYRLSIPFITSDQNVQATFSVIPPPIISSIVVTPSSPTLTALGAIVKLVAKAKDADGKDISPHPTFTWTSSNPDVATVSQSGFVTAKGNGTSTITASAAGIHGEAQVTVNASYGEEGDGRWLVDTLTRFNYDVTSHGIYTYLLDMNNRKLETKVQSVGDIFDNVVIFSYDEHENVVHYIDTEKRKDGTNSYVIDELITYAYDDMDKIISEHGNVNIYDEDNIVFYTLIYDYVYSYIGDGYCIDDISQDNSAIKQNTYCYDNHGYMVSETFLGNTYTYINTYSATGKILSSKSDYATYTYTYDNNDNTYEMKYYVDGDLYDTYRYTWKKFIGGKPMSSAYKPLEHNLGGIRRKDNHSKPNNHVMRHGMMPPF